MLKVKLALEVVCVWHKNRKYDLTRKSGEYITRLGSRTEDNDMRVARFTEYMCLISNRNIRFNNRCWHVSDV